MEHPGYFKLGMVLRPYSYRGEVIIRCEVGSPADYAGLERFFVEHGDDLVPYFITNLQARPKNEWRVSLEDVSAEQAARALSGKAVFLPEAEMAHEADLGPELIGFQLEDAKLGVLGEVSDYLDIPGNPQLEVHRSPEPFLVPLVPAFIEQIDVQERTIYCRLPEGLLDL